MPPSSLFFLSPGGREEEKRRTNSEREVLPWFVPIYPPVSLFSYFFLLFRSVGAQGQSFLPIPVFRLGFLCVQRGLCGRSFRRLLYTHTDTDRQRSTSSSFLRGLILFSSCLCCLRTQSGRESKNGVSTALGTSAGRSWPRKVVVLLFIYFFFLVDFDLIFFFSSSFYSFLLLIYQSQRSIESFLFRVIEAEDTGPFIA